MVKKKKIKVIKKKKFSTENILEKISFSEQELSEIKQKVEDFKLRLEKNLNNQTQVFIGGSYAKGTMMKKNHVDIDIFIIFNENEKISEKLKNVLKKMKVKFSEVHGSRDYYQVREDKIIYELVPIFKINEASQAKNITDISPLHVKWLLGKLQKKDKKNLGKEIMLAKSFCYGTNCYGAESYISGFSGYALEVLTIHFGSFIKLLKQASKWKFDARNKKKIIMDPEKYYKNEKEILEKLNESKIYGPLILIDPVQKERNVTAALSEDTLKGFIDNAKKFLKKPDERFFYKKLVNVEDLKKSGELYIINAYSSKDKVDVVGAKLKKFFDFLIFHGEKEGFNFLKKEIEFDEMEKQATFYLVIKPIDEMIVKGPPIKIEGRFIQDFKKKWPNAYEEKGRLFAKTGRKFKTFEDFLKSLKKNKSLKDMGISSFELLKDEQ